MNTCDVCGHKGNNVTAGRWIFYCPAHKQVDIDKTMENEINYDLENGNMDYINDDPELSEILESQI